jgi:hypothetical protein
MFTLTKLIFLIGSINSAVIFVRDHESTTNFSNLIIDDPNVCNRILTYNESITVPVEISYDDKRTVWCFAIPPRCEETNLRTKWENRTEIHEKTKFFRQCCDGYKEDRKTRFCVPNHEK